VGSQNRGRVIGDTTSLGAEDVRLTDKLNGNLVDHEADARHLCQSLNFKRTGLLRALISIKTGQNSNLFVD
jgi:hypothetical protein